MQVITVKYLTATATKGARYKASASCANRAQSITEPFDYSNPEAQVATLCARLVERLGWAEIGNWQGGRLQNGDWVFVCTPARVVNIAKVELVNKEGYRAGFTVSF